MMDSSFKQHRFFNLHSLTNEINILFIEKLQIILLNIYEGFCFDFEGSFWKRSNSDITSLLQRLVNLYDLQNKNGRVPTNCKRRLREINYNLVRSLRPLLFPCTSKCVNIHGSINLQQENVRTLAHLIRSAD